MRLERCNSRKIENLDPKNIDQPINSCTTSIEAEEGKIKVNVQIRIRPELKVNRGFCEEKHDVKQTLGCVLDESTYR